MCLPPPLLRHTAKLLGLSESPAGAKGKPRVSRQDRLKSSAASPGSVELGGDDILLQINLRLRLDEIADLKAEQLRLGARRLPTGEELTSLAYKIYRARRLRDRMMKEDLFGEPAWDMLLALFCLPARGQFLTITGLGYAANVPPTTGLRWQRTLRAQGLIECRRDCIDRRKQFVRLTESGRELMGGYLTRLFYHEKPKPPGTDDVSG